MPLMKFESYFALSVLFVVIEVYFTWDLVTIGYSWNTLSPYSIFKIHVADNEPRCVWTEVAARRHTYTAGTFRVLIHALV